jgi:hypothetical protein
MHTSFGSEVTRAEMEESMEEVYKAALNLSFDHDSSTPKYVNVMAIPTE